MPEQTYEVAESTLYDLYDSIDPENAEARMEVRRILLDLKSTTPADEARAEGFVAGLWFASLAMVCDALQPGHTEEWAEFFEGETAGAATDGFGVAD